MTSPVSATATAPVERTSDERSRPLPLWRRNLMRVAYFEMGAGLAVTKWPELTNHTTWELKEGTVVCILVAMSLLALLGLRYPVRMLPILLFEVAWKLIWLGVVALPLWSSGDLEGATREQVAAVSWVVVVVAVIPWHYVVARYMTAPGEPWRNR